jgi:hypothetical protein
MERERNVGWNVGWHALHSAAVSSGAPLLAPVCYHLTPYRPDNIWHTLRQTA